MDESTDPGPGERIGAAESQRLRMIAATAPSILHSYRRSADGHTSFPFGAERVAELYALPADELVRDASRLGERVHPDDLKRLNAAIAQSLNDRTPWRAEFRVMHPERGELWLEGHSMPVHESDGGTVWHGALTDITTRKRQEGELHRLNAELEHRVQARTAELQLAVKELEAFSYSVSHDLRAPLRALDGFSQAVLQDHADLLPPDGRRYLHIIRESALKMGQLIDDLLSFSRLTRQPLQRREIDTALLVREALLTLEPLRRDRPVELTIHPLPPSFGDPAMLRQVWINLLSNALKYSRNRRPATIEVGVSDSPAAADGTARGEFYVRDNGTGFDMRFVHKIFGVFERLHRAEEFEGTGVGLAIVQRVVLRHGGSVRAEAAPGQGATFYFSLGA